MNKSVKTDNSMTRPLSSRHFLWTPVMQHRHNGLTLGVCPVFWIRGTGSILRRENQYIAHYKLLSDDIKRVYEGHAFEMDYDTSYWLKLEEFFKFISNRADIFYGTNAETFIK